MMSVFIIEGGTYGGKVWHTCINENLMGTTIHRMKKIPYNSLLLQSVQKRNT